MLKKSIITIPIVVLGLFVFMVSKACAEPGVKRLAGLNRYQTSAAIARDGWQRCDYAVLVYGEDYPDALAAAPLAGKYDAPVLLTERDNLTAETMQVLYDLKVKNVFIIGGFGAVSEGVENSLKSMGIVPVRLWGQDRYETSVKVAEQLVNADKIAVVSGEDYIDALSIVPVAAKLNMPMILVPKDDLTPAVKSYISSRRISKSYIVGGSDVIGDVVASQFNNAERIAGLNKYERNLSILIRFAQEYDYSKVCLASGSNFADALPGSAYAAKNSAPVVLLDNPVGLPVGSFLNEKVSKIKNIVIFGGSSSVNSSFIVDLLSGTEEYLACLKKSVEIKKSLASLYDDLEKRRIIDLDYKERLKEKAPLIDELIQNLTRLKSQNSYVNFAESLVKVWESRKAVNRALIDAIESQDYVKIVDLDKQRVQGDINECMAVSSLISQKEKENQGTTVLKEFLDIMLTANLSDSKSFSIIKRAIKRKSDMDIVDMTFISGEKVISMFDDEEKIIQLLGQPQNIESSTDKTTGFYKREYTYADVSITTTEGYGMWYIKSIAVSGREYVTARGLRVGDTEERLRELYGEGYELDSGYDYNAPDNSLVMEIVVKNGAVTKISVDY